MQPVSLVNGQQILRGGSWLKPPTERILLVNIQVIGLLLFWCQISSWYVSEFRFNDAVWQSVTSPDDDYYSRRGILPDEMPKKLPLSKDILLLWNCESSRKAQSTSMRGLRVQVCPSSSWAVAIWNIVEISLRGLSCHPSRPCLYGTFVWEEMGRACTLYWFTQTVAVSHGPLSISTTNWNLAWI